MNFSKFQPAQFPQTKKRIIRRIKEIEWAERSLLLTLNWCHQSLSNVSEIPLWNGSFPAAPESWGVDWPPLIFGPSNLLAPVKGLASALSHLLLILASNCSDPFTFYSSINSSIHIHWHPHPCTHFIPFPLLAPKAIWWPIWQTLTSHNIDMCPSASLVLIRSTVRPSLNVQSVQNVQIRSTFRKEQMYIFEPFWTILNLMMALVILVIPQRMKLRGHLKGRRLLHLLSHVPSMSLMSLVLVLQRLRPWSLWGPCISKPPQFVTVRCNECKCQPWIKVTWKKNQNRAEFRIHGFGHDWLGN